MYNTSIRACIVLLSATVFAMSCSAAETSTAPKEAKKAKKKMSAKEVTAKKARIKARLAKEIADSKIYLEGISAVARVTKTELGSLPYRVVKPLNYDANKTYPLVIAMHGAGGRGTDNTARAIDAFKFLTTPEIRKAYPAFVVAPQCPNKAQWANTPWGKGTYSIDKVKVSPQISLLIETIEALKKEFSIDADRVYATGQSMGGYGCWDLIMRRPDLFAAAVPVCGAGDLNQAKNLLALPIWCFHGDKDTIVPFAASREMDKVMKELGNKNWKYTELAGVAHGSSKPAWNTKELIPWMFSQKRASQNKVK